MEELLNAEGLGLAGLENTTFSPSHPLVTNEAFKTLLLGKDRISDTVRKTRSKDETKGVNVKYFVKISESSKAVHQRTSCQTRHPDALERSKNHAPKSPRQPEVGDAA